MCHLFLLMMLFAEVCVQCTLVLSDFGMACFQNKRFYSEYRNQLLSFSLLLKDINILAKNEFGLTAFSFF